MPETTASLDLIAPGDTVTVDRILFDAIRGRCREQGVAEGTRLSCRTADRDRVVVETADGRAVPCERSLARFIAVTRAAGRARGGVDENRNRAGSPEPARQER